MLQAEVADGNMSIVTQRIKISLLHEGRVWLPDCVRLRGESCMATAILDDGSDFLAIGDNFGDVHTSRDVLSGEWDHLYVGTPIKSVSLSTSGCLLAETEHRTSVWDVNREAEFIKELSETGAALSPCGRLIAYDRVRMGKIEIKEIDSGRSVECIEGLHPYHSAKPIVWSPNGQLIAVGWLGCLVGIWRLGSSEPIWFGKREAQVGPMVNLEIQRFEFSPDGQLLACLIGGWDQPKMFVMTSGGEVLRCYEAPPFSDDVLFWRDGSTVTVLGERRGATFSVTST